LLKLDSTISLHTHRIAATVPEMKGFLAAFIEEKEFS
jgi:hypothetical protein